MGFFCTIADCYKKMFVPNGRASRREFWYFQLYMFLIYIAVVSLFAQVLTWTYGRSSVTALGTAPGFLIMLLILVYILSLPALFCVTVRRLHDTNVSGWWIVCPLLSFLIVQILIQMDLSNGWKALWIGLASLPFIIILLWCLKPSYPKENHYGPVPDEGKTDVVNPEEVKAGLVKPVEEKPEVVKAAEEKHEKVKPEEVKPAVEKVIIDSTEDLKAED